MEFFSTAQVRMRTDDVQRQVRVDNLSDWCASIDKVLSHSGEKGEIYSVWGEFRVHREVLRDGVRFTLPGCANALQWTVTSDKPGIIDVHATIAKRDHDPDFIESLQQFVDDWKTGIEQWPERHKAHLASKPTPNCDATSYGGFG